MSLWMELDIRYIFFSFLYILCVLNAYLFLKIGDVVMVEPEGGERARHSSTQSTVNQYGQHWWYVQVFC